MVLLGGGDKSPQGKDIKSALELAKQIENAASSLFGSGYRKR